MSRNSIGSMTSQSTGSHGDASSAELTHLLCRLQDTILHPTAERERLLRTSPYERAKLSANLQYANSSLAKLEQNAEGVRAPARRMEAQGVLNAQRDMLELLFDRLDDLNKIAADDINDNEDNSSEDEDLLGEIIPTPSQSADSGMSETQESVEVEPQTLKTPPPPSATQQKYLPPSANSNPYAPQSTPSSPETTSQQRYTPQAASPTNRYAPQAMTAASGNENGTLRERRPKDTATAPPAAQETEPTQSYTSARAALFANRRKGAAAEPQTSTATAEAILDQQRQEQDALSGSILKMASALKASSHRFSSTLEADKDVVGRAGEGIEKTEKSMEAARGRMGALRKMTEGKGWWGRIILYAWVYGLMVSLILFVFVLPKLRF